MQRSRDRFLTTHTGSLPRPDDLIRMMYAKEEGVPVDQQALATRVRAAVAEVVRKQADAGVDLILANALVVIDPMENPDGRARFLFQNLMGRAASPDPEPVSAEHDEPWPGGRSNHYLFDMNRDWFAMTQPETRGRVKTLLDW